MKRVKERKERERERESEREERSACVCVVLTCFFRKERILISSRKGRKRGKERARE
jgi:hypothetical protein